MKKIIWVLVGMLFILTACDVTSEEQKTNRDKLEEFLVNEKEFKCNDENDKCVYYLPIGYDNLNHEDIVIERSIYFGESLSIFEMRLLPKIV